MPARRSRAWYAFPLPALHYLEPALKIILPVIGMSLELYFDHAKYL
jgi:hypothetical protein